MAHGDDLGDYVKKTVAAHHGCIKEHYAVLEQAAADQAPAPQQTAGQATAAHAGNRARVVRARQRYEQVQKLKAEGKRIAAITRELRLAPGTARRYFHAEAPMNWWRPRWPGGRACSMTSSRTCTSAGTRGAPTSSSYTGRSRRWAFAAATPPSMPTWPPSRGRPRRPPSRGRPRFVISPAGSAAAPTTSTPVSSSSSSRCGLPARTWTPCAVTSRSSRRCYRRHGERLDTWIAAVRADDLPHLHTFANGLERDHAAVLAGLTLPYSSGAVEGEVCKIKFLKRLMFGRASYDLLRKMALLNSVPGITDRDCSPPSAPDPALWRRFWGVRWRGGDEMLRSSARLPKRFPSCG